MQLQRLYSVFRQDKIISRFSRASVPFQIPRTVARNTNFFSTAATGELQSTVTIPDLFVSFLAQKPVPNPSYAKVKWSQEVSMRNGRECYYPKRAQADFAYFAALLAPKAAEPEYQTICDYISWIFYFDDILHKGRPAKVPGIYQKLLRCRLSAGTTISSPTKKNTYFGKDKDEVRKSRRVKLLA
ncbi:predicted protein [Histoplasma capsulatum G186AR]|uniref:Uncharacterized protein n=1 Tax=Ajellomyces capsulatus (strain G186AR / H82 / ATCC MYA-2454 / RMSCC 2432) TaxID=447093 RepID=C0NEN7_AJECG|nr:uncharacterized protein HCBG_01353 [Histoplasma capsulatum G186AR]EEH09708.1 predicted protein [Histoplasma capsulatum G186AR]